MKCINILLFTILSFTIANSQELTRVTFLESEIEETSGLMMLEGKLITHNDSGGEPALYEIDTISGEISKTIFLNNATNTDWEDICVDDTYIYVADFGNNNGSRTNLKIYKLLIEDYLAADDNGSVATEIITFNYADQTDFTPTSYATNFDAEALIAYEDNLYLFTKNWGDFWTNIYALPKTPGDYQIEKIDSINTLGLVTGADYDSETDEISLIGYAFIFPFFVKISEFTTNEFSNGTVERHAIDMPNEYSTQIESIIQVADNEYFLTAETNSTGEASLYRFTPGSIVDLELLEITQGSVYPNPASDFIYIEHENFSNMELYNSKGDLCKISSKKQVDITSLSKGTYWLVIINNEGVKMRSQKVIIN